MKPKNKIQTIPLDVKEIIYSNIRHRPSSLLSLEVDFYVYLAVRNEGQFPPFILITESPLRLGTNFLLLRYITPEELMDFLHRIEDPNIEKEVGLRILSKLMGKGVQAIANLLDKEKTTYYEKLSEFTKYILVLPSIEEVTKKKVFRNVIATFEKYLKAGWKVDDRLLFSFLSSLINPTYSPSDTHLFQPFAPHTLIITNPKTGKSSLAQRSGIKYDRATVSRLLGYSDARSTFKGDLDELDCPVFLDEVQESQGEQIYTQLLSYLENGIARVGVGAKTIETRATSPIFFISNPKTLAREINEDLSEIITTPEDLMNAFENMLMKLTQNYEAFGSRIALVLFGNNFATAKMSRLMHQDELIKLEYVVNYLLIKLKKKFRELLLNPKVRKWLEKPLPEFYTKEIKGNMKKLNDIAYQFWKGHLVAHRHIRGMALRLAFIHNPSASVDQLIDIAKDWFSRILEWNLESFRAMLGIKPSIEFVEKNLKGSRKFEVFVNGLLNFLKDRGADFILHFSEGAVEIYEGEIIFNDKKRNYTSLRRMLSHNRANFERILYAKLGVIICKRKKEGLVYYSIKVSNPTTFQNTIIRLLKEKEGFDFGR